MTLLAAAVTAAATLSSASRPAAAQIPSLCDAVTGNLVANCGFETGSLGAWTATDGGAELYSGASVAHSGVYSAYFGQRGGFGVPGGFGAITQTLATTPGQTYAISFYGSNRIENADNGIRLLFGGTTVFSQVLTNSTYRLFTATGVATGTSTVFTVQGYNGPSYDFVDDFVVQGIGTSVVPEPSTWALLGAGLVGVAGVARRRRGTPTT